MFHNTLSASGAPNLIHGRTSNEVSALCIDFFVNFIYILNAILNIFYCTVYFLASQHMSHVSVSQTLQRVIISGARGAFWDRVHSKTWHSTR